MHANLFAFAWPCMTHQKFVTNSMIRGYHIFRTIWDAVIGEHLQCVREVGNVEDRYAVAVRRGDSVIGHIPQKISTLCSLFIRRGGTINCTVSGHRRYSRDLPQGGLEVPCQLHFTGMPNEVEKVMLYFGQKTCSEMVPIEVPIPPDIDSAEKTYSSTSKIEEVVTSSAPLEVPVAHGIAGVSKALNSKSS